ncbi:GH116 family glycosyl-hydrolase [Wenyingzhuangia sp. IMCC45533]
MKVNKSRIYIGLLALGLAITSCQEKIERFSFKKQTDKLVFKNQGIVSKDMVFKKIRKKGLYIESEDKYKLYKGPNYLFKMEDTIAKEAPSGMRSSIPLGGFGAGSVELRADGSFKNWDIYNNSPATGNKKVQLNDAFLALQVQKNGERVTTTLRTHPPKNLPAVDKIEYSGSFPVSKLAFEDSKLGVNAKLYAYSVFNMRNAEKAAAPCALFSLELTNPSDEVIETSFLFNLPNHTKGKFGVDNGLVITKEGTEPTSGNIKVAANGADEVFYTSNNSLNTIWKEFDETGEFKDNASENAKYGAISAKASLNPGETRTVTIALAWYLPNRPIAFETVGNYYTNAYKSSSDVIETTFANLPTIWEDILDWNATCFDNTLPDWLQDAMVNSLATITKTAIWTKDNRFRQWESFACPNINPIHIDFSRTLPYDLFYPEFKKSIMGAHGRAQRENGYIPEKLWTRRTKDKLDIPSPGRILGDCSPSFILSVYSSYKWDQDKSFVDDMWPRVKNATLWQINRSEKYGLPNRLAATYDLSGFGRKDLVSYNGFMHLAALKAALELGKAYKDAEFVKTCEQIIMTARKTLKDKLWTGTYFRNWWNVNQPENGDLHADTQYGQVWSYLLGLGNLMELELMKQHLETEVKIADTPYGLRVLSNTKENRDPTGSDVTNTVWQAGSIHWSILNLYLEMNPNESLEQAKKVITHWSSNINDQWDYADLTTTSDGYPHTNSHYGRQLMLWGLPLALSGQQYDANEGVLSFLPKMKPPYRLPFFTPHASGVLDAVEGEPLLLKLTSGELKLERIMVNGQILTEGVSLKKGDELILDRG